MSPSTPVRRRVGAWLAVACLLSALLPTVALAAAPGSAPTGLSPSGGTTVNGNPVFSWNGVSGATRYHIEVSDSPTFSNQLFVQDTNERVATPTEDLPLGTIYWRVQGRDNSGNGGPWAQTQFNRAWGTAPAPQYPADNATLSFPTDALRFTWSALPGAQSYELQIDDATDFVGATTVQTKNTSYVLTDPTTSGQALYWHVRGISSKNGVASAWSQTRSATVEWPGKPTLIYPPDGATVDAGKSASNCPAAVVNGDPMGCELYFEWSSVLGARRYQLQVNPNMDWSNNRTIDITVDGTRYAPPINLNNGNYYWRVRAIDASGQGNYGPWSDVGLIVDRVFQRAWTSRPVLVSPTSGTQINEPTFSWTPIDHAGFYQIEVSFDRNFASNQSWSCWTSRTTWTPYNVLNGLNVAEPDGCGINLSPGRTYYWHVRGIDSPVQNPGAEYGRGVLGLWSNVSDTDVWSFTYNGPVLSGCAISPANGATNVEVPTLTWCDVPGATRYHVAIVRVSDSQTVASVDTLATSWTPTNALTVTDGQFRWYVQPYDVNGYIGVIPAIASQPRFTLTTVTATALTPDPIGPANLALSTTMPSLSWTPVQNAKRYQVMYGVSGSGIESPLGGMTENSAFTYPDSTMASGTYFWYVQAYDDQNKPISSGGTRQFIISPPDLLPTNAYLTPARCATPPNCTANADTPQLSWSPVPGALEYTVYVSLDPNFTNIYRTYKTVFTHLAPRDSWVDNQANQAYYWFVRPARSYNTGRYDSTAQTTASAFQKRSEAVHLLQPANGESIADEVTFSWQDYLVTNQALSSPVTQEAKQYRIQVSTVSDFASIFDDKVVDQTFYTEFDRTYPEGPLYWRVQAIDSSDNPLTWSPVRSLTKSSPPVNLTYPANAATVTGVPYLQWDPLPFAASYDVQIARNGDTSFSGGNVFSTPNTKMSAFAYTDSLAIGDYAWRVRRQDADGRPGTWSTPSIFHFVPQAPALVSPVDGTRITSLANLLFTWSSPQPYPRFIVETSSSPAFSSSDAHSTTMMSWAPNSAFQDGTYYWRVKALNADSTIMAVSNTWSFTVNASPIARYFGSDRYATAADISAKTFPANCHCTAYIAYSMNFPDALAGAAAAGTIPGPVLLVATSGTINPSTAAELIRLQPTKIVVLGSEGVISAQVKDALWPYAGAGGVQRYAGSDRYGTAAAVSYNTFATNCGCTAYIAYSLNFPDALAGAAAAGTVKGPVLLANTTGALEGATVGELIRLRPTKIVVLGSAGVISQAVMDSLWQYAGPGGVQRYSGSDRYSTAADISSRTFSPGVSVAYIAYSMNFPDALAGAAAAGTVPGPVLLVDTNLDSHGAINPATANELLRLQPHRIIVLGSNGVISDSVMNVLAGYAVP